MNGAILCGVVLGGENERTFLYTSRLAVASELVVSFNDACVRYQFTNKIKWQPLTDIMKICRHKLKNRRFSEGESMRKKREID